MLWCSFTRRSAVAGNRLIPDSTFREPWGSCRVLLASLVALLVTFPFLEDVANPLILMVPIAAIFVAAVAVVDSSRHRLTGCAAIIAAAQISLTILSLILRAAQTPYLIAVTLALVAAAVLILFAIYCVLRYVLGARSITRDQIYAGICMYLMLGFAFGAIFYLINILDSNSFATNTGPVSRQDTPDLMYFSFVTLATLGYGDITPRTNIARCLAEVEATAGMMYMAVFMARLVSMRSSSDESG